MEWRALLVGNILPISFTKMWKVVWNCFQDLLNHACQPGSSSTGFIWSSRHSAHLKQQVLPRFWKNSGLLLWLLECTQYTGASEEEETFPGPIHIHNRSEIWLAGRWIPNIPERVEAEYPGPTRQFYWKCQRQNVPILANIWRDADNNPLCCWS